MKPTPKTCAKGSSKPSRQAPPSPALPACSASASPQSSATRASPGEETLSNREKAAGRPPKTDQTTRKLLEEDVKERPAATVADRRRFLHSTTGNTLSDSTVLRLLRKMGFSQKNGAWRRWNETSS